MAPELCALMAVPVILSRFASSASAYPGASVLPPNINNVSAAMGAEARVSRISIVPLVAALLFEARPVAVVQNHLDVLNGLEVEAGFLPDTDDEGSIERPPVELVAQIWLDQLAIRAG
jgi:hypothetical protein